MKRRTFVQTMAVSAAGCSLPARFMRSGHRVNRISLELYSVRAEMKKDPEGTLTAVRAMGYDDVELLWSFGNFGRTNEQVKAALINSGLRAPSAHIDPSLLTGEWNKSLDAAAYLGQQFLVVPSLTAAAEKSLDEWKRWADRFNVAGAVAREYGIWLAFHNEPNHSMRLNGIIPLDLFLSLTDPASVRLQLDTGNMRMGGGDPLQYLKNHRARICSFHIKDVVADNSKDCELGTGSVDFKAFFAAAGDLSGKPVVVEQEGSPEPLESARRNVEYLRELKF